MSIGTTSIAPADNRKQLLTVLPEEVLQADGESNDSRAFLRLPHPRNNQPSLYLPYKPRQKGDEPPRTDGILEVQKVEPNAKRSWFLDQTVLSDGSLLLFTPIDPLFLVIPLVASLLSTRFKSADTTKPTPDAGFSMTLNLESDEASTRPDRFLPLDDLIIEASRTEGYRLAQPFTEPVKGEGEGEETKQKEEWTGNADVIALCRLESVRSRLKDACETQSFDSSDASEESTFYRASPRRILQILRTKVDKLAEPATLSTFPSLVKQILRNGLDEDILEAYKTALEPNGDGKQRELEKRQRIAEQARTRVACEIIGQYLSPDVFQTLVSSYDFSLLEEHLDTQAAVAFASSHTLSGKTNGPSATDPAAKPDVKRKGSGQGSRGVEKLKKVNTSKMPKLTSFFTKKPKE